MVQATDLQFAPQAIICDMDGLLLDSERMCLDALLHVAADHGLVGKIDITAAFLKCVGNRAAESNAIMHREFGHFTDVDQLLVDWSAHLAPLRAGPIPTKLGAADLLAKLHQLGYPIAVATSTKTDMAEEHLRHAGLLPFIRLVVGGDQVIESKPAPETYLTAATRLRVDISRCVAFEDSDLGTLAAVRSGARTVQVPDLKQPSAQTVALGHFIAPTLALGAIMAGLPV